MRKRIIGIVFIFGVMSCSQNTNGVMSISSYNTCSSVNISDKKNSKINVPDNILSDQLLEDSNYVVQEVNPIKGDKSLKTYLYNSLLTGKVFDKDEEIVPLFKITDSYNEPLKYKVITDVNLDYFLVIYSSKKNHEKSYVFIKKFDLNGNQIGEEIKLSSNISIDFIENINYSFDKNGKDLILAWTNFSFAYRANYIKCSFIIFNCRGPAIVPPSYYHPVLNYIRFDDKLNYCFNDVKFDTLVSISSDIDFDRLIKDKPLKKIYLPYITKDHEKIILQLDDQTSKELNLKDRVIKSISSS